MRNTIDVRRDELPFRNGLTGENNIPSSLIHGMYDWGSYRECEILVPNAHVSSIAINVTNENSRLVISGTHSPEHIQLCLLLTGGAVYKIDQLSLGDMKERYNKFRLAFSNEPDYKVIYHGDVQLIHLDIDSSYYTDLLDDHEKWSAELKERILKGSLVFQKNTSIPLPMLQSVRQLMDNPFAGNLRAIMIEAKLLEIIAWQLKCFSSDNHSADQKISLKDQSLVYELKEHLDKTFMEEHSLKTLSKRFGLNEFKIKTIFKQLFSKTVFDYIIEKRLNTAFTLLQQSQLPIMEIGALSGYQNPSYFSTAFKRQFGLSPSDLRKD